MRNSRWKMFHLAWISLVAAKEKKPNYEAHEYRMANAGNIDSEKAHNSQTPGQCITPVQNERKKAHPRAIHNTGPERWREALHR